MVRARRPPRGPAPAPVEEPLAGLCPAAVDRLGGRRLNMCVMRELAVLKPKRQVEVVRTMVALNCFSVAFAAALVMATPPEQLTSLRKRRGRTLTEAQRATMQRASARLLRQLTQVQGRLAAESLDLVLLRGFLDRLLSNGRVVRHLVQHHPEALRGFQEIVDGKGPLGLGR